jgi:hypothetical protein
LVTLVLVHDFHLQETTIDETLQNIIKTKHPKKGGRKENNQLAREKKKNN